MCEQRTLKQPVSDKDEYGPLKCDVARQFEVLDSVSIATMEAEINRRLSIGYTMFILSFFLLCVRCELPSRRTEAPLLSI